MISVRLKKKKTIDFASEQDMRRRQCRNCFFSIRSAHLFFSMTSHGKNTSVEAKNSVRLEINIEWSISQRKSQRKFRFLDFFDLSESGLSIRRGKGGIFPLLNFFYSYRRLSLWIFSPLQSSLLVLLCLGDFLPKAFPPLSKTKRKPWSEWRKSTKIINEGFRDIGLPINHLENKSLLICVWKVYWLFTGWTSFADLFHNDLNVQSRVRIFQFYSSVKIVQIWSKSFSFNWVNICSMCFSPNVLFVIKLTKHKVRHMTRLFLSIDRRNYFSKPCFVWIVYNWIWLSSNMERNNGMKMKNSINQCISAQGK